MVVAGVRDDPFFAMGAAEWGRVETDGISKDQESAGFFRRSFVSYETFFLYTQCQEDIPMKPTIAIRGENASR
jgi:hypothetical protein